MKTLPALIFDREGNRFQFCGADAERRRIHCENQRTFGRGGREVVRKARAKTDVMGVKPFRQNTQTQSIGGAQLLFRESIR